jgi:hypothetical protein
MHFLVSVGRVILGPLGASVIVRPIVPAPSHRSPSDYHNLFFLYYFYSRLSRIIYIFRETALVNEELLERKVAASV